MEVISAHGFKLYRPGDLVGLFYHSYTTMEKEVGILDMDGYTVERKFYCKQLGMLKVGDAYVKSIFFDTGLRWSNLSEKDIRSAVYVRTCIHKLPFGVPTEFKPVDFAILVGSSVIFTIWSRSTKESLLAYKGGHIERDLLERLNILSINLETLGCPKACDLFDDMIWLETCGNHTVLNAYAHCSKVEVEAFGQWVESQRRKEKEKK